MPDKKFLETYPLYRKFVTKDIPDRMDTFPDIRIKMNCPTCASDQTFAMNNEHNENCGTSNHPPAGVAFRMVYLCTHCQKFERLFFIKIDEQKQWVMKIGQYPAWEISGNPKLEKLLGINSDYFKKGLICESQGYGIGAYGYYRRIVEIIIDELLDEIADLLSGDEKEKFNYVLEKTKQTTVAHEKIELAKELLPTILRPDGMNPLSILHATMSKGLHAESDEDCLEYAESCREILVFLVNQVAASKENSRSFTERMRKLLKKKLQKTS